MGLELITGRTILLYQMPKCGSQTLEATLQRSSLPAKILRLHSLSRKQAAELKFCIRADETDSVWRSGALEQLREMTRISRALRLRRLLVACGARIPRLEVITAVRDVIGAGLSSVFENHRLHAPTPELLTPEICREKLCGPRPCGYFQAWFDQELKPHIGVDVYATPFPVGARHRVYENRFARVLLYRFDFLSQLGEALNQFLGVAIGPLISRNLSASKQYAKAYKQVKAHLRLPGKFVVEQLGSRMMRHFYSAEERAKFHRQWTGYFLEDVDHLSDSISSNEGAGCAAVAGRYLR